MTTVALPLAIPSPHTPSSGPIDTPITPPLSLESLDEPQAPSQHDSAPPIPNKHIPVCPTGPANAASFETPPPSPTNSENGYQSSTLYPADSFRQLNSNGLCIYEIDAAGVAEAVDYAARQPLPHPTLVFPWLHGLHPQNHLQQAFFSARKRTIRKTPCCFRGVTLVKADGNLCLERLKGAIAPEEILLPGSAPEFIEADPREGFSVRNFQIQSSKTAYTSDIIVYGSSAERVKKVAWSMASAQKRWRTAQAMEGLDIPEYNTFICTNPFMEFEESHEEIVAVDSRGCLTDNVIDLVLQERREMWNMTEASEISHNVFLGPSPEPNSPEEQRFDVLIECSDIGRLNPQALQIVAADSDKSKQAFLEFPSSGSILPPTWSHSEADGILDSCKWIYHISHGTYASAHAADLNGDSQMLFEDDDEAYATSHPRKVLIHCADGYTESTMLGIAYFSYSTGRPIPEAWLDLHTQKGRNFFAYPTDVSLLTTIAPRLLRESPVCANKTLEEITNAVRNEPKWLPALDGSLPSRVLDYLYLGNLGHANNPSLLKEMGICQVLSVGETVIWRNEDMEDWGEDNICVVQGVQDNGIDPLTEEFARCLDFIERGRRNGTATLVHCRVGVSRSATICIAEVMREFNMSLPRAYCFVRARRLNVIIQPHLRFAYELLRWEEFLQQRGEGGAPIKRELEWGEIAREIALMNRPYSR